MFYNFARWVFGVVIRLLFKLKIEGLEKIPPSGALVVCANHISWWDPCLIAYLVPRPVHFMAKKELFQSRFLAFLFGKLYAFPVNREKPDIGAIKQGLSLLKNGHALGVFPEGTRQKTPNELGQGHAGAALLAMKTEAPLIPIAIRGTYGFRKTIRVACGEPFRVVPSGGRLSDDLKEGSQKVMLAIKDLWDDLDPNEVA